jgi:XTP/dITP diphosphohydrolase
MKKQLLFATGNLNKVREVNQMLDGQIEILSLRSVGGDEELPETTNTIEGNAQQKAKYAFEKYKIECFAEDTGLEISALDGQPGVHSARYAGDRKDPEANISKVLLEMQNKNDRSARFRTVIALILNEQMFTFEGIVEGEIRHEKSGTGGFGYDPIFQPLGYSLTFGEMPDEEKNKISHRARAVKKLMDFLKNNI